MSEENSMEHAIKLLRSHAEDSDTDRKILRDLLKAYDSGDDERFNRECVKVLYLYAPFHPHIEQLLRDAQAEVGL